MDLDELIDARATKSRGNKLKAYPHRVDAVNKVIRRLMERKDKLPISEVLAICKTLEPARDGESPWPARRTFNDYIAREHATFHAWTTNR